MTDFLLLAAVAATTLPVIGAWAVYYTHDDTP